MVPVIEEICPLCGETYPYYQLQRCYRCGRLYCRNCVALNEGREIICLNCFRRIVSPRGFKSKYAQLSIYLARRAKYGNHATLSFRRIEEIIGDDLPYSAHHNNHWWNNTRGPSHSEAWLTTGWIVQEVNLENQEVTFQKKEPSEAKGEDRASKGKGRRKRLSEAFKALAHKQPPKRKGLSKTKIARVQARARNIRRKSTGSEYRGKFKPRRAYEKRLYKHEEEQAL